MIEKSEAVKQALIEKERRLHKADFDYGAPLHLMDGYVIAFHAADCPRCSFLAREAINLAIAGLEKENI